MNMDFMHLHIIFYWLNDSMIIWCGNIDIKEDFLRTFWWPNFFMYLDWRFFLIKSFT
jgi:hypothetical protein